MSLASTLAAGRASFEQLLTDTCRITEAGVGKGPFNESTGKYDPPARVVIYEGPCRIQVKADINSNVVEATAGEREQTYLTAQLQTPVETPDDAIGDVAKIDVDHVAEILEAPYSRNMVGRQFNIQDSYDKSHAIYTRFRVKELAK